MTFATERSMSLLLPFLVLAVGCGDESAPVPQAQSAETAARADGQQPTSDTAAPDASDPDSGYTPATDPTSQDQTTRRLSNVELGNTLDTLTGIRPVALELLPPDSLGFSFDRVVASQSMSRAHLDAFFQIAAEVGERLLSERRLDELSEACPDAISPPLLAESVVAVSGATLALGPDWAVATVLGKPLAAATVYAKEPTAGYSHGFPAPGSYALTLHITTSDGPIPATELWVGGALVQTFAALDDGQHALAAEVIIASESPTILEYRFFAPGQDNLYVEYDHLDIAGPIDGGADPAARRSCAEGLLADLAPQAWRRPLTPTETESLLAVYDAVEAPSAAFVGLFEALLVSPHFLYLVEVGEPVPTSLGKHLLDPWELAARLSYALCERPPDAALRQAAADGALKLPDVLEDHARRLLDLPCGQATVHRFFVHWLWLDRLVGLNKSPDAFPGFDAATLDGLKAESDRQLRALVQEDDAGLSDLFGGEEAWLDPRSAWLSDATVDTLSRVALPAARRGILTSPAVMAVTAPFETTNPVKRGVFVLEQLLCEPIALPPPGIDISPPVPDPTLTTRDRWAAHTESPACAACHLGIDPVGFSLEGFDGIGRHRTQENGLDLDVSGGVPALGIPDGELTGGAELAAAITASDRLSACAAEHWLQFALGRHAGPADEASVEAVAEALRSESMKESLVRSVTTPSFLYRFTEAK